MTLGMGLAIPKRFLETLYIDPISRRGAYDGTNRPIKIKCLSRRR